MNINSRNVRFPVKSELFQNRNGFVKLKLRNTYMKKQSDCFNTYLPKKAYFKVAST